MPKSEVPKCERNPRFRARKNQRQDPNCGTCIAIKAVVALRRWQAIERHAPLQARKAWAAYAWKELRDRHARERAALRAKHAEELRDHGERFG